MKLHRKKISDKNADDRNAYKNKKSDIMSLFSISFTAVQAGNDFC